MKKETEETLGSLPDQKELEREIAEYLAKKYGDRVKIVSASVSPQAEHSDAPAGSKPKPASSLLDFSIKPEDLVGYLDQYVVGQHEAKAILATRICTHFNRIRYNLAHPRQADRNVGQIKSNVLMIGPTGVGKTYLIKLIAKRIGVPFIKGDATKFSETGYVGGDVEDLIRDLVREADGDLERAQYGIIYLDEVDKIAGSQFRLGVDVSRTGVQRALLKPMEETDVELKVPHDPISQIEAIEHYRATGKREKRVLNTKNILFIMSGAFGGLEDIVRKRTQQQAIGFEGCLFSKREACKFLKQVKAEDLIEFGFESEFVGRLPVIAVLDELEVEDLFQILSGLNSSLVVGKKSDFLAYGIGLLFEEEALREIAARAHREQTGARGLVSVMEKVLLPFEMRLPSTEIRHLAVTLPIVLNPHEELQRLLHEEGAGKTNRERFDQLASQELERIEEGVRNIWGGYLEERDVLPTPERVRLIARQCLEEHREPGEVCDACIELINQIRAKLKSFSGQCGMAVDLEEDALDRLLLRHLASGVSMERICGALFREFEYGFRLLKEKKDVHNVLITATGIDNPKKFIEELVGEAFRL